MLLQEKKKIGVTNAWACTQTPGGAYEQTVLELSVVRGSAYGKYRQDTCFFWHFSL